MPRSPDQMMAAVSRSLEERTGRSLAAWVALVQESGIDPLDRNAVRRWLGSRHGVLQNSQWAIADAAARAAGWEPPGLEACIDAQYAGARSALRPVFERLRALLLALGDDVVAEARASYTPFVRARQFAAIAASTRTRVDVGLRYDSAPRSALLSPASGPGQATHRLSLTTPGEVTAEVERLLRIAYEQNG